MSNESSSARCSSYWKVWRYSTGKTWLWFIQDAAKSAIGVFLWSWSHELSCFPSNLVAILTISETASFVRCLDRGPVPHQAALITPTIPALWVLLSAEMPRVGRDAHIMWFVFKAPQRWVARVCYDSQYSGHYRELSPWWAAHWEYYLGLQLETKVIRMFPKISQSRRRPLLGPSPGWKRFHI